ncbi:MAG: HIT domain-containing protein [bacterium]
MDRLWAPWRIKYILGGKPKGCIFCDKIAENRDKENLILYRAKKCFVIMNLYPYNSGHLMVVPNKHCEGIDELSGGDLLEVMKVTQKMIRVFEAAMRPQGYNIGINLGQVAGAGIHDHLHVHIVPRWLGDTNFMPVASDSKTINEDIARTYDKLAGAIREDTAKGQDRRGQSRGKG